MILAIFISDIHSNLEALEAFSQDAPKAPIYCLGDIVGYGADPNETISWVKKKTAGCILGNHDYAVTTSDSSWFNHLAANAINWTRRIISSENLSFLTSLRKKMYFYVDSNNIMITHGSPRNPLYEYIYQDTEESTFKNFLKTEKTQIIGLGHTHKPFLWRTLDGLIFNPGSIGQPRSGVPEASYAILKKESGKLEIEHRRIKYDVKKAAQKIISSGLPTFFAERLFKGV